VRVGVVGVGALGHHHARVYASLAGATLVGVFDVDHARAESVAARHGCQAFPHLRDVVESVDAVSVAVPTVDHHRVARALLDAGKDVLVEKPIAATLAEADDLIAAAGERGALLQVGHVERFNPVTDVLRAESGRARFIEVHRLGSFSARSLDIDVVFDLIGHLITAGQIQRIAGRCHRERRAGIRAEQSVDLPAAEHRRRGAAVAEKWLVGSKRQLDDK